MLFDVADLLGKDQITETHYMKNEDIFMFALEKDYKCSQNVGI